MTGAEQGQLDMGAAGDSGPQEYPRHVPPGYDVGRCRACPAEVMWVTMVDALGDVKINPRTQRPVRNPLNTRPRSDGGILLVGNKRARTIGKGELVVGEERRISHFVTCPAREKFKGGAR